MKIIASWDDGTVADLKMAELMQKYGIETTFYWPSSLSEGKNLAVIGSWLSEKQCKEISKSFKIGSHSITQKPMRKMDVGQISREINDSKKYLQDLTGQEIDSFAYPKESYNNMIAALLKGAGYKTARTYICGHIDPGPDAYHIQCTVQIGIDRIDYKNKSWEIFASEMHSKCKEDSVFHLFGNSWDVETYYDWNNLEDLLKLLTGKSQ